MCDFQKCLPTCDYYSFDKTFYNIFESEGDAFGLKSSGKQSPVEFIVSCPDILVIFI